MITLRVQVSVNNRTLFTVVGSESCLSEWFEREGTCSEAEHYLKSHKGDLTSTKLSVIKVLD